MLPQHLLGLSSNQNEGGGPDQDLVHQSIRGLLLCLHAFQLDE